MNQSIIQTSIIAIALIISAAILSEGFEVEIETENDDREGYEAEGFQPLLLNLEEASEVLGLSEKQIKRIIVAEQSLLEKTGSFTGTRLPYIKIDGEYYFSIESIMGWVQDNTARKREYDGFNIK